MHSCTVMQPRAGVRCLLQQTFCPLLYNDACIADAEIRITSLITLSGQTMKPYLVCR